MYRWVIVSLAVLAVCAPARGQGLAVLQEARMLVVEGDHRAAAALLGQIPADSLGAAGYYLLGVAYQGAMQHEQALAALERADTTSATVRAALGRSLDLLGRTREAAAQYARAFAMDSSHTTAALNLAKLKADLNQWEDVAAIYRRLLAEDDANAFLHAQLATAYRALDSLDGAIVHYEHARRLNPRSAAVALSLSGAYMATERFISASRVIDDALREQPEEPALWQRSGDLALHDENFEGALEAYRTVLQLGDSTALSLRNVGVALYLTAEIDSAEAPLLASFAKDSTDGMTAFYLGALYQQAGAYDEALAYLERAAGLMGRAVMGDVFSQIAATLDQMDEDGEAVKTYRLAQALNPDDPETLFHLAALYDTYYADPSAALEHYNLFLKQTGEGRFTDLQAYARQRVSEITEMLFFKNDATSPDTTG